MKMNRKQRRDMMADLRKKDHMSKTEAKAMVEAFCMRMPDQSADHGPLRIGAKAKIDFDNLIHDPSWAEASKEYKAWVEMHKNEVLTIGYNSLYGNSGYVDQTGKGSLISFKEDKQNPPIVFFSTFVRPMDALVKKTESVASEPV